MYWYVCQQRRSYCTCISVFAVTSFSDDSARNVWISSIFGVLKRFDLLIPWVDIWFLSEKALNFGVPRICCPIHSLSIYILCCRVIKGRLNQFFILVMLQLNDEWGWRISETNLHYLFIVQLEYDVLEYVVIERLAQSGRDKLKDDGLNVSDWLQSLASFWGHL